MTRLFNFLFFIFLLPLTLYSQTVQIKGSVVDSLTREPLPYATIQVINISNKTVFAGIAYDSLASFNFSKVDVKNGFMVMVSYVGYQRKEIPFNIKLHQKTLDFGFIALMPDINLINEVQVTGQRKVQNLLDRIVYVMDSTILSKAIGTPDILSSLPEIMVNPITLETKIKGKENSLVLVNGINTGRSIDIRSINPRDIEKVEVITSPPSSVDVDYDGVINIVLKREPRKGYSGDFDATFMPSGRYIDAYSGIVIGGKKTRTNIVYTNYLRNNSWESSEIRNNTLTNESYKTNGYCNNPFEIAHSFLFNLDYYPSPNNFINISTQNSLARVDKDISFKPIIINNGTSTSLTPFSIRNNSEYFIGNYTIY
ncbi:MAG TPA: carboxypeptidase-like regulatory domain-containing protein [Tenuifilaceae bacterium]|nr:carboxypeptidase-like regulatory domain-containing protein [Tenuifilaceae bacterium]